MVRRSISVVREAKVSDKDFQYVMDAIREFLNYFMAPIEISVNESSMVAESGKEVDEYLYLSRIPIVPSEMIDGCGLNSLILEGANKIRGESLDQRPYLVTVVDRDLRWKYKNWSRIYGLSSHYLSAIISVREVVDQYGSSSEESIKTTTVHELGHMFGLISEDRIASVVNQNGTHCANWCIMSECSPPPLGYEGALLDLFLVRRFCPLCRSYLYSKFKEVK